MVIPGLSQREKTMIKTNKEVIHLIHGLLAKSAATKPSELKMIEEAIYRTKKELTDYEILIAYYAFEAQKQYMDYLKQIYKEIE